jgi:hypothetical protein
MSQYVIRFGLGVDNTQVYLKSSGFGLGTTVTQRQAVLYASRKEAAVVQDQLLAMSPKDLNKVIRKGKDYSDHVSISVISCSNPHASALNVRHKLYNYMKEPTNV